MKTVASLTALTLAFGLLAGCATSVPQLRYQADGFRQSGDWEGALKKYDEVLAKAPEDFEARRGRGQCLLHLGRPQPAETELRLALTLIGHETPASAGLCDDIANAKIAQGDRAGLTAFLAEEVKRHGSSRDFVRQGRGLAAIGDVDGAIASFRKAEIRGWDEGAGERYVVYLAIADFYGAMRDQPNALRYVQHAAHVNHNKPEIAGRLTRLGRVPGPSEWVAPPTKEELLKTENSVVETK